MLQLPPGEGVLPNDTLLDAIAAGVIAADDEIPERNVQPASLDLRLGDRAYRIRCSFLPDDETVERKAKAFIEDTVDLTKDGALLEPDRLLGSEGQGLSIAFSALDSGRLGIAAIATGLAQAALDVAVDYARERTAFGKPIAEHEGLGFLLADMAAGVDSARATYLDAARRRDAGMPYSRQASVAKLIATDTAMRVTTDAVQVLGGYGYTRDFPVERFMREAKVMQIFEGTNQIQRLVISRGLQSSRTRSTVPVELRERAEAVS
jgi:alkylation response protein AidB-like acyl-CoA dehydrogenase